jgi:hypothetical protein
MARLTCKWCKPVKKFASLQQLASHRYATHGTRSKHARMSKGATRMKKARRIVGPLPSMSMNGDLAAMLRAAATGVKRLVRKSAATEAQLADMNTRYATIKHAVQS